MENDVLYNRIMNVVHEEYGEGSTAVANPEGEPTDDLTSIQIGDEIYGISGGGGGGIFVVNVVFNEETENYELDKTYNEIVTSINNKIPVYYFYSASWEDDGVTLDDQQLYPVSVCKRDPFGQHEYQVFVIGFRGGTFESKFSSSTRDGVLVFSND